MHIVIWTDCRIGWRRCIGFLLQTNENMWRNAILHEHSNKKTNYLQKRCVYIQIFLLLGSAAATGCWCCRCGFAHVRQNVIVKRWRCRWLHHFVANWARRRRSAGIAERCTGRRHRHLWQSRCRRIANKSSRLRWILKSTAATTATQIVAIRKIDQRAGTFF